MARELCEGFNLTRGEEERLYEKTQAQLRQGMEQEVQGYRVTFSETKSNHKRLENIF